MVHQNAVTLVERAGHHQGGLRDAAAQVRAIVGLPLTAYLAHAGTVQEFVTSVEKTGNGSDDVFLPRLVAVLELATIFRTANALTRMRAWLREVDERLDNRSPASLIRESPDNCDRRDLPAAVERHLQSDR